METPIYDFVEQYIQTHHTRFHMPGHKGHVFLGCEPWDITEIDGADILHQAEGIIAESQRNASALFRSGRTFYSTEGSSLCIKAMLAALVQGVEKGTGQNPRKILAARNVHRSMVDACGLLDLDLEFVAERQREHICTGRLEPEMLRSHLQNSPQKPIGVYLTSPDYLGEIADIAGLAAVCKEHGIPLVVDNAHGAYLGFLEPSGHPLALGAAMCCDSAHKTLPVLTGGAYLHLSEEYQKQFEPFILKAFAVFGSTSPSYLILESLDLCNRYLAQDYRERLSDTVQRIEQVKKGLERKGIPIASSEPLKLVIKSWECGYTGIEIAQEMREENIECEYADAWYLVLMLTVENTEEDYNRLLRWAAHTVLCRKPKAALPMTGISLNGIKRVCSIREAILGRSEIIPVEEAAGRICAAESVACPPAIPIAVSGEVITEEMISLFLQYNIRDVDVLVK